MKAGLLALLSAFAAGGLNAQIPFSKWIVQNGDSVNDNFLGNMDMTLLSNGDLLNCTCRDEWGSYEKCRFVRISPAGDPVQQWEVSSIAGAFWLNRVIEMADGSFACFGRYGYASLYLHLDPNGGILTATSYEITGIGIIAPWEWNDAVEDPGGRFTLAGEWGGMSNTAMMARIATDGTLLAHNAIQLGTQGYTFFQSVARLSNGDHVFCGASNYTGYHPKTYLFRTDSLLYPQWARAYPDSGYNYTSAKLLAQTNGTFRIIVREQDPGFIGSTLMVAAGANGSPMWARRRIPDPDYPNMNLWPKAVCALSTGEIVVAGSSNGGGYDEFVQVLDASANELGLIELDIPTPRVVCEGDAGAFHISGINHGPLGLGALSVGLTQLDLDLDLCTPVDHTTTSQLWFPSMDATWSEVAVPVTVTDVAADFLAYPTTAYSVTICVSTGTATTVDTSAAFGVAPNPMSDRLSLSGSAIQDVELCDLLGQVLIRRRGSGAGTVDLDVRSLPPGCYVVRARDGERWHAVKVVKA
jgi:hypothetical protein